MRSPLADAPVPNTRQPISPPGSKLKSRGEISCPSPFGCSSLMFILQRCHTRGAECEAREWSVGWRGEGTREGERGQKVLWMGEAKERRGGEKESKEAVRRESGCARLTTKGEKRERDQWRGCISGTSQANYPAPSPPFPSFFSSHFSLTFFDSALTIHVLSTARDP